VTTTSCLHEWSNCRSWMPKHGTGPWCTMDAANQQGQDQAFRTATATNKREHPVILRKRERASDLRGLRCKAAVSGRSRRTRDLHWLQSHCLGLNPATDVIGAVQAAIPFRGEIDNRRCKEDCSAKKLRRRSCRSLARAGGRTLPILGGVVGAQVRVGAGVTGR
jgi:hypothetical protein